MLLLGLGATLGAQTAPASSLRDRVVAANPAGQLVDTLTVAPKTLEVYDQGTGRRISGNRYELNGRFLSWVALPPDSVRLRYRVLPFRLDRRVTMLDSSQLTSEEAGLVIGGYDDYVRSGIFDNDTKVRTAGSFSRAISFGNRQDLVLNSAFNLQLDGELGNGIEVSAAITDESLPVQPEGTTQQLREFDRIFIQLRKNRSQLTAGDYELRHPDGYFLRFFKKLEGATFTSVAGGGTRSGSPGPGGQDAESAGEARWTNQASIAVARGQFIRQQIQPVEGNQGPYKLTGNGGQQFLIILAGTERIFLDGQLLRRGLDGDYVIDYNLAELTFTPRRLITRDSRITAEYEFADQRYLRTLTTGSTRYETERFTAYLNAYSQQDSRTATGDLELTPEQRAALAAAGDVLGNGIAVSSIDTLDGRAELRATYTLVDTVTCEGPVQFLRLDPAGRFVATFTDRGPGGGEYVLLSTQQANGRVYEYVGRDPVSCEPLGRFLPEVDLVAPEQQQLLAVGGAYLFRSGGSIRMEASRSRLDRNRFSREDSADDNGSALRLDADREFRLGVDSMGWRLSTRGHLELLDANFNFINPYRSPEFFRNWNLSNRLGTSLPERERERILGAGFGLERGRAFRLDYDFEQFSRGGSYLGRRHAAATQLTAAGWKLNGAISLLTNEEAGATGSFRRPRLRLDKTFEKLGGWTVDVAYEGEQSIRNLAGTDTLSVLSFQYDRYGLGLSAPANDEYRLRISANQRIDQLPSDESLTTSTEAREVAVEGNYTGNKNFQLGGNFTYRDLAVPDPLLVNDVPNQTFLGRMDVRFNALQRSLRGQTTYQVGSGQEPRVEFQYLYVGPGLGQYIWQDSLYNNDGKIQPNEMEISPFADIADYVRVSVFTNDFIRTNNVALNQKLNWDPVRLWREASGLKKFLKRLSVNSSFIVDRKTREDESVQSWNPFQLAVPDSSLVALNVQRRIGLFFNRTSPTYDIQLSNGDRRNRRVLTTGYESNRTADWTLRFRYRPNTQLSLETALITGQRSADSEFFNNKDFRFDLRRIEPSINWQPKNFRLLTRLIAGTETNVLPEGEGENTQRLELQLEANYRRWLTARFRWVDIALEGDARSPVGFALLQGLQPGRNLLWNLGATRQLGQYLQLTLSYEGRQTGTASTVHVGRAQVQAFF
ncbi:hypothetical protein [Lewinella sp. W8]|uniref:hypothetical protein n=1 Tax=Lewinella sp. W8 TaxID=2528208 RepID=UPI0010673C47|nr:hypothetical protein [Lewinella sp. W8]MTB52408.1 hypothetical protein [Lewinella sp. W8]